MLKYTIEYLPLIYGYINNLVDTSWRLAVTDGRICLECSFIPICLTFIWPSGVSSDNTQGQFSIVSILSHLLSIWFFQFIFSTILSSSYPLLSKVSYELFTSKLFTSLHLYSKTFQFTLNLLEPKEFQVYLEKRINVIQRKKRFIL